MEGYKPEEKIPSYLIEKYNLLSKNEAIFEIHNPTDITLLKKARQRLKYEELFLYLLKINYLKQKINSDSIAITRTIPQEKIDKLISKLPYELTIDQKVSLNEILEDMSSSKRMNRLLQGDVGSGKTIIALIASYANYLSGYQTAIMVPTEVLVNQHFNTFNSLFKEIEFNGKKIKVDILSSSITAKERKQKLEDLASGEIDIIVGTHSLFQKDVSFV